MSAQRLSDLLDGWQDGSEHAREGKDMLDMGRESSYWAGYRTGYKFTAHAIYCDKIRRERGERW